MDLLYLSMVTRDQKFYLAQPLHINLTINKSMFIYNPSSNDLHLKTNNVLSVIEDLATPSVP